MRQSGASVQEKHFQHTGPWDMVLWEHSDTKSREKMECQRGKVSVAKSSSYKPSYSFDRKKKAIWLI